MFKKARVGSSPNPGVTHAGTRGEVAAAWMGGVYGGGRERTRREERDGLAHLEECDLCCAPEGGHGARTPLTAFFNFPKIYCRSPYPMLWLGMVVVGLTGGLASGKTTVAGLFKSQGAIIIDADQLARTVVEPGKPAWRDILREFGPQVLASNQTINRRALAKIVFRSPKKLQLLQKIIHPRVAREQAQQAKIIQQHSPHAVIIYDAALLLEAGAQKRMDHVIVVVADRATQITRACRRDGLNKTQALRRIKQQMPLRQKLEYVDAVLDGTWPRARLRRAVRTLYRTYANEARQRKSRHGLNTPKASRRSV